jgi:hypothetical protein
MALGDGIDPARIEAVLRRLRGGETLYFHPRGMPCYLCGHQNPAAVCNRCDRPLCGHCWDAHYVNTGHCRCRPRLASLPDHAPCGVAGCWCVEAGQ